MRSAAVWRPCRWSDWSLAEGLIDLQSLTDLEAYQVPKQAILEVVRHAALEKNLTAIDHQ